MLFVSWVISPLWCKMADFGVCGRCVKLLPSQCTMSGAFGLGMAESFPCPSHPCHLAHSLLTLLWPTCTARATHVTESLLSRKRSKAPLKIQQRRSPSRHMCFSSSGHDNRNSVGHKPQKVESCASISCMSFVGHPKPLARALFSFLCMFFHDF